MDLPKIVLASKSPRRKMLLERAGFSVEVMEINCDETFPIEMPAEQVALHIAGLKAEVAKPLWSGDGILITADTVVDLDGAILEKPVDKSMAEAMLAQLSGARHIVHTGVVLLRGEDEFRFTDHSEVQMAEIAPMEIEYYLEQYQPYDKAGSYGIQDWIGWTKVMSITGSYANIMGLPIERIYRYILG